MNLLDQLVYFYNNYEDFHKVRLDEWDIKKYFTAMINSGRLITVEMEGELMGYCDYSRISYEQLGEVVLCDVISPEIYEEDSKIVFITTICISPFYRGVGVLRHIKRELERRNPDALWFVGKRQGKHYKPIVIFKRKKNKVVTHGNV